MKKNNIIKISIIVIIILTIVSFALLANEQPYTVDTLNINYEIEGNEMNLEQYKTTNPIVAMEIENYGSIVIELYPEIAENTVNNFISLVQNGFYDNNTFHRLIPGFVLQGGDPNGQGTGGPGYHSIGEFNANN